MVVDPSKVGTRWALPILKVQPGQRFRLLLGGSRWWFFGSHWLERQFLCVGGGCEGCVFGVPRVMGYRAALLEGGQKRRAVLLEAPLTSISRMESLAGMEALCCDAGATLEATRRHRRAGLCLEAVAPEPEPDAMRLTDQHTVGAVSVLFSLPPIEESEEPPAWAARVQNVDLARLVAAIAKVK
jgi:hypothetical protein